MVSQAIVPPSPLPLLLLALFNINMISKSHFLPQPLFPHPRGRGFTLIEMLVVISIIGVLMALSFIAFQNSRTSARDAKRRADLESIRSALELFRADCNGYPSSLTFGGSLSGTAAVGCSPATNIVYMDLVPQDSLSPTQIYYYNRTATNTYQLCAKLETGTGSLCGNNCGGGAACNLRTTNP